MEGTSVTSTELMNRTYRYQRHIYDFTRKYFLLGRDRLIDDLAPRGGDAVLEVGCGTGRNLSVAAARYPAAQLYGIDVSTEMLASASASIARASLSISRSVPARRRRTGSRSAWCARSAVQSAAT